MSEQEDQEWQAPPIPEQIPQPEQAEMSELATIGNIFIEPGRTFEDLRRKPRFIIAAIITAVLVTAYAFGLQYKVGEAGMRRFVQEQIDKNPQASGMSAEQKSNAIDLQVKISGIVRYAVPVFVLIAIFIGGLLYWLGAKAFGGSGGLMQNVSVFVYSGLPPAIISMVANAIVLMFKSADEIDIGASQRGVISASPAMLLDGKAMPVVATLVGSLDLFMIWGWILAAIGLRITNKLSSGSAWAITIIFALIGITFRVIGAVFSGNPG